MPPRPCGNAGGGVSEPGISQALNRFVGMLAKENLGPTHLEVGVEVRVDVGVEVRVEVGVGTGSEVFDSRG